MSLLDTPCDVDGWRPPIFITPDDHRRLTALLPAATGPLGPGAALLAEEMRRAHVCEPEEMPAHVVRIGSRLRYRDLDARLTREVILVLPADADPRLGKLSVLTPDGAALIGLPKEQVFPFPGADGEPRQLIVLEVFNDFL